MPPQPDNHADCVCLRRGGVARDPNAPPTAPRDWEWREFEGRSVKYDLKKDAKRFRQELPFFTQVRLVVLVYKFFLTNGEIVICFCVGSLKSKPNVLAVVC
jgi:hypothetical protein